MFDFLRPHSTGWYNMRNPLVAEMYHPTVNNILRTINPDSSRTASEDFFKDEETRARINAIYMDSLSAKSNIGIDAYIMAATNHGCSYIESMAVHETDAKFKDNIVYYGMFAAIERIRDYAFGVAPGLATNKDHARAITADLLYEITCRYAHTAPGGLLYQFGSTCRSFGRRFDRPGWAKMPRALAVERQQGWVTGYHVPETEQRAFAA